MQKLFFILILLYSPIAYSQTWQNCMDSASFFKSKAHGKKALQWANMAYAKHGSEQQSAKSLDMLVDVHYDLGNINTPINYLLEKIVLLKNSKDKKLKKEYFTTLLDIASGYVLIKEFSKADSIINIASEAVSNISEKDQLQNAKVEILMNKGQWETLEDLSDISDLTLRVRRDIYFGKYGIVKEMEERLDRFKDKNSKEYRHAYLYCFPAIRLLMNLEWGEDFEGDADKYTVDSVFNTAEKIVSEHFGKSSLEYFEFLRRMAEEFQKEGDFEKADSLYKVLYAEGNKNFGIYNSISVDALTGLGEIYYEAGYLTKAQKVFEEVNLIADRVFGNESMAYADFLRSFFYFNLGLGRYAQAREQYKLFFPVIVKERGYLSNDYAILIYCNAELAKSESDFLESERLVKEAIAINEKNGVDCNPCFINLLISLATIYQDAQEWGKAEETYMRASDFLDNHAEEFSGLEYYLSMKKTFADFYTSCKALKVTNQLKYYPDDTLVEKEGLKMYVSKSGNYKAYTDRKIIEAYQDNIDYYTSKYGARHPSIAEYKTKKAIFYWIDGGMYDTGDNYRAGREFREALDLSLEYIHLYLPYLSEKEKTQFYSTMEDRFNAYYAFGLAEVKWNSFISSSYLAAIKDQMGPDSINYQILPGEKKTFKNLAGRDTTLERSSYYFIKDRNNSSVLNYRLATKGIIFNSSQHTKRKILSSGDSSLINNYSRLEKIRHKLSDLYISKSQDSLSRIAQIDSLEKIANSLERHLSEKSEVVKNSEKEKKYTWKDIQKKLKYDESAVEIIRYSYPTMQHKKDSICYAALIVDYYTKDNPKIVLLKNGFQMESQGYNYYKNAIQFKLSDEKSYHLFWKEIDVAVSGSRTVYFSPDGIYNMINLSSLKTPSGKFLLEEKDIRLVTDLKDLMHAEIGSSIKKNATIIGDPDFTGQDTNGIPVKTVNERSVSMEHILRGGVEELPGTKKETDHISQMLSKNGWNTVLMQKKMASEENLKSVKDLQLLHLATHGFFLKEQNNKVSENPLLRSGLLLAGVAQPNKAWSEEDGILTAYEAMNLDLENTEIVILSACETGLGEVSSGEGVYGLQRAFRAAGAKSLIMSLWKVNDASTNEFMTYFYSEWLKTGDKKIAFRNAQLKIKSSYPHSYYWAAFVLISSE